MSGNTLVTTGPTPLVIGSIETFVLQPWTNRLPWDVTGGTVDLLMTDPNGVQYSYPATIASMTATVQWPVIGPAGVWTRAWSVTDATGAHQTGRPIVFDVILVGQPPTITSVTDAVGNPVNSCYLNGFQFVQIHGTGLGNVTSITFGSAPSQFVFTPPSSTTQVNAMPFPVASPGTVFLTVNTPFGSASVPWTFKAKTITGTLLNTFTMGVGQLGAGFNRICNGTDSNLWWSAAYGSAWTMKTDGTGQNSFALAGTPKLYAMIAGSGGNLWGLDVANGTGLWKIPPSGVGIVNYLLPGSSTPNYLCIGPDGNFWINDFTVAKMWRVTDAGVVTTFPLPVPCNGICTAPDGFLYMNAYLPNQTIYKVNTQGQVVATFPITGLPANTQISNILVGSDGNLWSETYPPSGPQYIIKCSLANPSNYTAYTVCTFPQQVQMINVGPDGNLYAPFIIPNAGNTSSRIAVITPAGVVTTFDIPGTFGSFAIMSSVCTGADGSLWFTEYVFNVVTPFQGQIFQVQ